VRQLVPYHSSRPVRSLRDRAMLLMSAQTAFRGESARILLWSDLFQSSVRIDDLEVGRRVPVWLSPPPRAVSQPDSPTTGICCPG
jgi:hypothetical protein